MMQIIQQHDKRVEIARTSPHVLGTTRSRHRSQPFFPYDPTYICFSFRSTKKIYVRFYVDDLQAFQFHLYLYLLFHLLASYPLLGLADHTKAISAIRVVDV